MNALRASGEIWLLADACRGPESEAHAALLAGALRERGWSARVLSLVSRDSPIAYRPGLPDGFFGLLKALRRARPGLLHTVGPRAGVLGRAAARLSGTPIVSTFYPRETGELCAQVWETLDRLTAPLGECLTLGSESAERAGGRTIALPQIVAPVAAASVKPDLSGAKFGFVGRLSYETGPDLFCDLAKHLPFGEFAVYGEGPLRAELRARYEGPVKFGKRPSEPARLWRDIDVLCVTARREGLPAEALEAMAHGVPVAAFAVPGLAGAVERAGGYLAAPGDSLGLENRLRAWSMSDIEERRARSAAARRYVETSHSAAAALPAILAAYRRACARAKSREPARGGA